MNRKFTFLLAFFFVLLCLSGGLNSEPRRMVLEFCTGTWCGYCPCGHVTAEAIKSSYPGTIVIAYHGGANSSDPWWNFNGNSIRSMLGFAAYPTGVFDRTNHPGNTNLVPPIPYVTYNMWYSRTASRYSSSPTTSVDLTVVSNNYNPGTRQLTTTIDAKALENLTGQYKIVYVLTEDNVVYPQYFYASCGTLGYHNDYVHKSIARSVLNDPNGENLNTGTWNQNQIINKSITTTLDNAWVADNCIVNIIVYREDAAGLFLSEVMQGAVQSASGMVGVTTISGEIPESYVLSQNFPNPFNPVSNIHFSLPKDGNASLKIYNATGKEIATYADGFMKAGSYNVDFDGSNLSSGIYFYTLMTSDFIQTKKMVLIK